MDRVLIDRAARWLYGEHGGRQRYRPLPDDLRPRDETTAYAIQQAFIALSAAAGLGPPAGYKIALTTPVMQRLCGVDHPCAGTVLQKGVHELHARVRGSDFMHLGIEAEIALRLGATLAPDGAPYTRESVGPAVAACMAAIEIVDDRNAAYEGLRAPDLIADNTWNAGIVLGTPVSGRDAPDLAACTGRMVINDREAGVGRGADVLGHPLNALAWLANLFAAHGRSLSAGAVVMTGSMVSTRWLAPGDRARVEIDGLGEVAIEVA